MILDAFFAIANQLLQYVMSVRPNWMPGDTTTITQLFQVLAEWDWILPVHETVICIGTTMALVTVLITWKWVIKIADWVADVIP
jgi:hypothetical protein